MIRRILCRLFRSTPDLFICRFSIQSSSSEKSDSADCRRSVVANFLTDGICIAKSHIALKELLSSIVPNLWIRTISKALHSFRYAGSLAWWEYTNLSSLISTPAILFEAIKYQRLSLLVGSYTSDRNSVSASEIG